MLCDIDKAQRLAEAPDQFGTQRGVTWIGKRRIAAKDLRRIVAGLQNQFQIIDEIGHLEGG